MHSPYFAFCYLPWSAGTVIPAPGSGRPVSVLWSLSFGPPAAQHWGQLPGSVLLSGMENGGTVNCSQAWLTFLLVFKAVDFTLFSKFSLASWRFFSAISSYCFLMFSMTAARSTPGAASSATFTEPPASLRSLSQSCSNGDSVSTSCRELSLLGRGHKLNSYTHLTNLQ